jgi:hypothetical protein
VDGDALGAAQQVIVLDPPAVGVEPLTGREDDRVEATAGVGELHLVTGPEGSALDALAGGAG